MFRLPGPPFRNSDSAVVLCADRKYFAPAYVVCMSLVRDQPERHDIYLLTEAGPHLDRVPQDVPFNILTPDFIGRLPNIPELFDRLTPFTYLRLFVADILEGYRRVLYLDCDIRVDGSIAPLLRLDMKGAPFAAVDDGVTFYRPSIEAGLPHLDELGFRPGEPYLNAGVLLIDCDRWRRDRMTRAAIDCMNRLGTIAKFHDQDVLNVAFRASWLPLSPRWNFPDFAFETDVEDIIKPVVYHHIFVKPWQFETANRRETRRFREALRSTPYGDFLKKPTFHQIKRVVEARAKHVIQNATFFLPSSRKRIRIKVRARSNIGQEVVAHIIKNVRSHRFADIDQNISVVDVPALSSLLARS
jgi:lipopolysaccharide biosynthesis glycosyltransferase